MNPTRRQFASRTLAALASLPFVGSLFGSNAQAALPAVFATPDAHTQVLLASKPAERVFPIKPVTETGRWTAVMPRSVGKTNYLMEAMQATDPETGLRYLKMPGSESLHAYCVCGYRTEPGPGYVEEIQAWTRVPSLAVAKQREELLLQAYRNADSFGYVDPINRCSFYYDKHNVLWVFATVAYAPTIGLAHLGYCPVRQWVPCATFCQVEELMADVRRLFERNLPADSLATT